jgi:preprotein translocase subunit Sec61beta
VRAKQKERLALAVLWILTTAVAIAGRSGRFGPIFDRYSWSFVGASAAWLVRSFLPEPEEGDPVSIQALPLVAVYVTLAVMMVLAIWFRL